MQVRVIPSTISKNIFAYDASFEVLHICKPTLKNSYIQISKKGEVILKSPPVSQRFLKAFLDSKRQWIEKKLLECEDHKDHVLGVSLYLFGTLYSLDAPEAAALKKSLKNSKNPEKIQAYYNRFYLKQAKDYLHERCLFWSEQMGLYPKTVKLRKMIRRWGSCNSKKEITFNTQLIKADKNLIDYVIVHELAHLEQMNHSPKFYKIIDRYIVNYRVKQKELAHYILS